MDREIELIQAISDLTKLVSGLQDKLKINMDREKELILELMYLTKIVSKSQDTIAKHTECMELLRERIEDLEKDVYNEA